MVAQVQLPSKTLGNDARSQSPATFELSNLNLKGKGRGLVITITEPASAPISQVIPPQARVGEAKRTSSPLRRSTTPEVGSLTSTPMQPSHLLPTARSPVSPPKLVRTTSLGSTGTHSPVMRSMFPRFDPTASLDQQNYYPNMDRVPPPPAQPYEPVSIPHYSPSLYSPPQSPPTSQNQWRKSRVPSSTLHSPLHRSHELSPSISKSEDLLDLWTIANGQAVPDALETYTLGLQWYAVPAVPPFSKSILSPVSQNLTPHEETICLVSPDSQLYTLHAAAATLTIARTHPITTTTSMTIMTPTIHTPSTSHPLVADIYPKLAELDAVDKASSIAVQHHLSRQDSKDLQAEALRRSRDREAAELLWDSDSQRYYLIHPSLNDDTPLTFPIVTDGSTIRFQSREEQTLLVLSLDTNTLVIHTTPLAAFPSPYILDILLSAILTLTLHLHRRSSPSPQNTPNPNNPYLSPSHATGSASTPNLFFAPPPTSPHRLKSSKSTSSLKPSLFRSPTTRSKLSHRSDAASPHSPASSGSTTDMDLEKGPASSHRVVLPLRATSGVDLSQFQSYDVDDPNLPRGTRMVLKALYWAFGCLVWVLGVGVGILAAGCVAVGSLAKKL